MKLKLIICCLLCILLVGCQSMNKAPLEQDERKQDSSKATTFLLIGVDSRGEKDSRADTIMLARYEPKEHKVKLASIMRDSYVKIPHYKHGFHKINAAYYYGGSKLMKETIKENFYITVDYVAVIDFQGFVKMVDLLAPEGIEVDVKEEMITDMSIPVNNSGKQKLHGEDLLKYVRFRHDDENDFGRVERQQQVISQLKDSVVERVTNINGLLTLPELMEEGMQYVETDMKMKAMLDLGSQALFKSIDSMETLRIPVAGSFSDQSYPHAGAVLQLDIEKNADILQKFFQN